MYDYDKCVERNKERIDGFQALEMLLDIKAAFEQMVAELDWMDAETRARAHRKLHAIRPFVGIPDWITNSTKLDKFYEGVRYLSLYLGRCEIWKSKMKLCLQKNVVPGRLFDTFLMLTDATVKKSLNSLREKPDKNRWISSGTTVNAFYSAILNSVSKYLNIIWILYFINIILSFRVPVAI